MLTRRRKTTPCSLTLPLEHELLRLRLDEQYKALHDLQEPLEQTFALFRLPRRHFTLGHANALMLSFGHILLTIQVCIDVLNGPDLSSETRPYRIIRNLSLLHRKVLETQTLIECVVALCTRQLLVSDRNDLYGHLRDHVRKVNEDYLQIVALFEAALRESPALQQNAPVVMLSPCASATRVTKNIRKNLSHLQIASA